MKQDFNQLQWPTSPADVLRTALKGSGEDMKRLIAAGADIEARNAAGHTPLMIAAARGNLATAEALLDAGADLRALANNQSPVIALTAGLPDSAMTELLLTRGADPLKCSAEDRKSLLRAAVARDEERLFHMLADAGTDFRSADYGGRNLLMLACESGQPHMAKLLIEAGLDPQAKDTAGHTAAWRAARRGNAACLEVLLDAGVKIENDRRSDNLLCLAAKKGADKAVALLLARGAGANPSADSSDAPLRLAIKAGNAACVEILLKHGADPLNEAYEGSNKITDEDCAKKAGGEVEKLVCAAARKFHLPRAAKEGDIALVRTILDEGVAVDVIDRYGKTALVNATENAKLDVARLLVEHKADVNFASPEDNRPLLFGAMRGADWESPDPDPNIVDFLLTSGANPNCRYPEDRQTALAIAVEDKAVEMAARLLKHKADPNLGWGDDDRTPLFQAVAMKSPELVKLLLDNGASVLRRDKKGVTPYDLAKECPNAEVREMMCDAHDQQLDTMAASATQSTASLTVRKALKIKPGSKAP